jgi:hypothetical protein
MPLDLSAPEIRVLGCLLEKERTTPEDYPLTRNALMRACNQSTSRDPVVAYDEATVEHALDALRERRLTRIVYSTSNRAPKYRHVLDEAWAAGPDELAVLCVLALRGPQTVGELKARTERLHAFDGLDAVQGTLDALARRDDPLVGPEPRRPGRKEVRWVALLGAPSGLDDDDGEEVVERPGASGSGAPAATAATPGRLDALEAEVAALRAEVERLAAVLRELGA